MYSVLNIILITKSFIKILAKIEQTKKTKQYSLQNRLDFKIYYSNAKILTSNTYCVSRTNIKTKVCKDNEGC